MILCAQAVAIFSYKTITATALNTIKHAAQPEELNMTNNELYTAAMKIVEERNLVSKNREDLLTLETQDFLIKSLNIDPILPPTPIETGFINESQLQTSILELIAFNISLGLYPVVYEGENNGRLIRHVCPKKSADHQISSHGSALDFLPHVDNPDLPITGEACPENIARCPDTLSLLSLRSQENVYTSLLILDDILCDLSENDLTLLSSNNFIISRPDSFENSSSSIVNLPILNYADKKYYSRFDYHNTSSTDPDCLNALNRFKALSLNTKYWRSFNLQPGEVLIFNNQRTSHSRNKFICKFDGYDRWLLRLFGVWDKPHQKSFVSNHCHHHLKSTHLEV